MRVIGILSGKGGVGKTTLTTNLGLALKNFGKRVVTIDCNITTPHLAHYLGAYDYSLSLNDVLRGDAIITSSAYYHNGILLIPASQRIEDLDVDIGRLKNSIKALEEMADIVLLDSAPSLGREALSVLEACEEVIFVSTPLLPAINDIIKCKRIAKNLNKKILGIVLNIVRNERYELRSEEIEALAGIPVIAKIPFEPDILNGLSKKIPILHYKPESKASIECVRLASSLIDFQKISEEWRTDADRILEIVRLKGSVKISEVAKRLSLPKKETKDLAIILREKGLIEYHHSIFGDRLSI